MPLKDAIYTWLCIYSHWDQPSWALHPFTPGRLKQLPNSQAHQPPSLQDWLILHSLQASSWFTCYLPFPQRTAKYGCQTLCITWKKKKRSLNCLYHVWNIFLRHLDLYFYFCLSLAPVKAVHSFPAYGIYSLLSCLCLCWFFLLAVPVLKSDLSDFNRDVLLPLWIFSLPSQLEAFLSSPQTHSLVTQTHGCKCLSMHNSH